MKAMVMTKFGGSEVLSYQDIDTPELGPDDVLVEVRASRSTAPSISISAKAPTPTSPNCRISLALIRLGSSRPWVRM